jgi:transposase
LAGFLIACGAEVSECERPSRRDRRRGKSDLVDAAAAARRLLAGEGLSRPRGIGPREDLRALLLERRGVARARTAALNQLHGLLLSVPASLRERLDGVHGERLARSLRRLHGRAGERGTGLQVLRPIARRVTQLSAELAEVDEELQRLTATLVPELLAEVGVGPVAAAQLLVSSGDPARMRSEAAFAALAGTSPIDASSGQQRRHRLNRGGDRQLNYALHLIASNRVRYHPQTSASYTHLIAAGKTKREALRCVKRALARYFYRQLQRRNP